MLKLLIVAVLFFLLARAIVALVAAVRHAGRLLVRAVLKACILAVAAIAGIFTSVSASPYYDRAPVLGLQMGDWLGVLTTCLLLAVAAYSHGREAKPASRAA